MKFSRNQIVRIRKEPPTTMFWGTDESLGGTVGLLGVVNDVEDYSIVVRVEILSGKNTLFTYVAAQLEPAKLPPPHFISTVVIKDGTVGDKL
jgi:hypothetical protein